MIRHWCVAACVLSLASASPLYGQANRQAGAVDISKVDALVLCPPGLMQTLQPWIEYRSGQGHQIAVIRPGRNAYEIKSQIRGVARFGHLTHVVIVGDVPGLLATNTRSTVPTDYVEGEVNVLYGSEPEIATDTPYSDLDDDGIPDLAIGRIPADTPQQLADHIQKVISYEAREGGGAWRRRINFVAGTGGFGTLQDQVIEMTAKRMISDLVPAAFDTSMTYASCLSPYCPDPRRFVDTSLARLNEGCLFWVYIGHGHPYRLDYLRTPIGGFPIMQPEHIEQINCPQGKPVALMLSCYSGAFDMPRDCFAERMIQNPQGPIAAICATRVAMPYGMSVFSLGLTDAYFFGQRATLGGIVMQAKQSLASTEDSSDTPRTGEYRRMIDLLGKTFSPTADQLAKERLEHVTLFQLLGDPLLKLPRPELLELSVPQTAEQGQEISISGVVPEPGELVLELSYPRDRYKVRPVARKEFEFTESHLNSYQEVYQQVNDHACATTKLKLSQANFTTTLRAPAWAKGRCVVRAYFTSPTRYALGAADLRINTR